MSDVKVVCSEIRAMKAEVLCGREGAVQAVPQPGPVQSCHHGRTTRKGCSDCLRECRGALDDAELRADFCAREFNLAISGRFEATKRADRLESLCRELAQKLEDMTARAVLAESMIDRKTP